MKHETLFILCWHEIQKKRLKQMGLCANTYYCNKRECRKKHKNDYYDPSSQFKDYKYFKIKKASNKEIKSSVLNENFLCRADRTKVLHIPKSLLLYDLGKKYEGQN